MDTPGFGSQMQRCPAKMCMCMAVAHISLSSQLQLQNKSARMGDRNWPILDIKKGHCLALGSSKDLAKAMIRAQTVPLVVWAVKPLRSKAVLQGIRPALMQTVSALRA